MSLVLFLKFFWVLPYFWGDSISSTCVFLALILESAISPRNSVFFIIGEWCRNQDLWVVFPTVSCL